MRRGEIYYAMKRPVLIISNDANNRVATTLTVLPITSNTKKVYPFEVLLTIKDSGLAKISKVQCQQIRTISKIRIGSKKMGGINEALISQVENAVKLHLGLD